ncbi:MAG: 4-alpha-glucanotransferase [Clostridia bacterium]|nr:4-alpha-glucanotransferase [Clostridia bacterium]
MSKTKTKNVNRKSGVLMPISSLPSKYGIGDLGKSAYRFVDYLCKCGAKVWQVLPLLPTGYGDSPYQSCSADALNYYFIDFEALEKAKLLSKTDYQYIDWGNDRRRVDYGKLFTHKAAVLKKAFYRLDKENAEWQAFLTEGKYFDFAVFMTLKVKNDYRSWEEWGEFAEYDEEKVAKFVEENEEEVLFWQFTQFIFLKQWQRLKAYANKKGISIMGDMPIYLSADSVENWKYRKEMFLVGEDGKPSLKAGVPPDAFSDDGQLWGNPVYDWAKMKESNYSWWKDRIAYALSLFDIVRIDHFRGFDRFYAVPSDSDTAKVGEWMQGPSDELFTDLKGAAIVAEDLGMIDDSVREMMKKVGYPGMKVLEFAFDGNPQNDHLPSNYGENCVAYSGTHDNMPLRGYLEELSHEDYETYVHCLLRECSFAGVYCGRNTPVEVCQSTLRLLYASKANLVVVPMQDLLCYGAESRINEPSTAGGNWTFRFIKADFKGDVARFARSLAKKYHR